MNPEAFRNRADSAYLARRRLGGYGLGEGSFGIVENHVEGSLGIAHCNNCPAEAVLYFVDSATELQRFACLDHTAAIAYDAAVASTADPDIPREQRGRDDRLLPSRQHRGDDAEQPPGA